MNDTVMVTPAIDIQVVFGADGNRAFQARFAPIALDVDRKELDHTLDKVLGALDRQAAYYKLADLEARLLMQVERIKKYEAMLISVDENAKALWESEERRGPWNPDKLKPQDQQHRTGLQNSLQKDTAEAQLLNAEIKDLRKRVNSHATDRSADRNTG